MATCALTTGFERYNCETVIGGIQELYLLPMSSFTSVTVTASEVTAITSSGTWYGYQLSEEVGLLETTETFNKQNNSLFYDSNCSFTLNKMEAVKSNELALVVLQRVVAIVKTENGEYFFMGDERGCHKAGGTNNSSTGTAFGDLNGYNMNLQAMQSHDVYEVQASVVSGLTIDYNS
jgi:hypothetical protein